MPGKGYSSISLSYREAWTETFQEKEKGTPELNRCAFFSSTLSSYFRVLEAHRLTPPHSLRARSPGRKGLNWVCAGPTPAATACRREAVVIVAAEGRGGGETTCAGADAQPAAAAAAPMADSAPYCGASASVSPRAPPTPPPQPLPPL